jgi:uncharacterized protein YceH (UPF0502 family)
MEALHPSEVRVLGALLEKDITTPEYYPLTLNALVNACNQKSSREPIVNYGEEVVTEALASLQYKGLALRISGAGHRVEKFGHRLGEKLNLGRREMALLCVLMLRGAQTVGELRGRTERMHQFDEIGDVLAGLQRLAEREPALVAMLPRQPGTKESRYAQLLGGPLESLLEMKSGSIAERAAETALGTAEREERIAQLEAAVAELRQEVAELREKIERLAS